jgi:hypothetical protein
MRELSKLSKYGIDGTCTFSSFFLISFISELDNSRDADIWDLNYIFLSVLSEYQDLSILFFFSGTVYI